METKPFPAQSLRYEGKPTIETGLRWGELTELRVKDVAQRSRILTISCAVVEVNPKFHPDGERFIVKEYPKHREFRRFKLTVQIMAKLEAHIEAEKLEPDDLLFVWRQESKDKPILRLAPDPLKLGLTEPNAKGRRTARTSIVNLGMPEVRHSAGRSRQ